MLSGIAFILIGCFVVMPKAVSITLIVFGALKILRIALELCDSCLGSGNK